MKIIQNKSDWDIVKYKLIRKFNSLKESELIYNENEDHLVEYLQKRLCKPREYIIFMLNKMIYYKDSNRL